MLAAWYEQTGPAAQVLTVGEMPEPQPAPGEVRVRIEWSGINPSDVKSRAGVRSKTLAFQRIVPHSDGAGTVDAVGEGVDRSRIGQRVWVWNAAWGRAFGTAAQYVCLPQAQAVHLPERVSAEAGACMGIPALTALHAVLVHGGVQGQRVLVAGGAGAVGHYAVQMCRLLGAEQVIASVSGEVKAAHARAAGADVTVNYRDSDAAAQILQASRGGVDRVIEVDAAANAELDAQVLKAGGLNVVYGSGAPQVATPFFPMIVKNIHMQYFIVYNLGAADRQRAQAQLQRWLELDVLRHAIAQRHTLADVAGAHEQVESGRVMGNVVLSLP